VRALPDVPHRVAQAGCPGLCRSVRNRKSRPIVPVHRPWRTKGARCQSQPLPRSLRHPKFRIEQPVADQPIERARPRFIRVAAQTGLRHRDDTASLCIAHEDRHAIEPRHESFRSPALVELARKANVAIVFADADKYPQFADLTADFTYARLQNAREEQPTGYSSAELDRWAETTKAWAAGQAPEGYTYIDPPASSVGKARDAFVFMINGAKVRAPAAAMELIKRLGRQ